jgi:hypothetical protein
LPRFLNRIEDLFFASQDPKRWEHNLLNFGVPRTSQNDTGQKTEQKKINSMIMDTKATFFR